VAGCARHLAGGVVHRILTPLPPNALFCHTPAMTTDYSDLTSRVLDGEALRIGSVYWPRPEPPLLAERARLVATVMPAGTLAAGNTAGWVWTGMGLPTPLCLIASTSPAPSPLARHQWKIRGVKVAPTDLTTVGPLVVLTPSATEGDLWRCEGSDEVAAAQLFWLHAETPVDPHARAKRRGDILQSWRANYPWATR